MPKPEKLPMALTIDPRTYRLALPFHSKENSAHRAQVLAHLDQVSTHARASTPAKAWTRRTSCHHDRPSKNRSTVGDPRPPMKSGLRTWASTMNRPRPLKRKRVYSRALATIPKLPPYPEMQHGLVRAIVASICQVGRGARVVRVPS